MYPNQQMEGIWEDITDAVSGVIQSGVEIAKGALTALPGVSDAVNYVKAKVGQFFGLPARIAAASRKAEQLRQIAQNKGLSSEAAQIGAVQSALLQLQSKYTETESKVGPLLEQLKGAGFGLAVIPIAIVSAAAAVAAAMAYLFQGVSFNEDLLTKIEKKVITPQEATALFGPKPLIGIDFKSLLLPVGLLVGGAVAIKAVRPRS